MSWRFGGGGPLLGRGRGALFAGDPFCGRPLRGMGPLYLCGRNMGRGVSALWEISRILPTMNNILPTLASINRLFLVQFYLYEKIIYFAGG